MRAIRLLHETLDRASTMQPDKTVAIVEGTPYTFERLQAESIRLATALQARGFRRGDRLAIFMDNTWPCLVAIYACLRAGGVFVIINPQTKADKLAYVLNNAEARILLTDAHLQRIFTAALRAGSPVTAVICSGASQPELPYCTAWEEALSTSEPLQHADTIASDLAALIYTSGSTGQPKGVMHTHQSMLFALNSLTEYLRLGSEDRILNVLPMAFDYGLYQALMAVALGATLVLERSFMYPAQIFNRVHEHSVTVFPGVPTVFTMMAAAHQRKPLCFPEVTRVTNTAAALTPALVPTLREIFPSALIYKMYGQTECKRVCYLEPELLDRHADSVGRAIPGTEVYLKAEDGSRIEGAGQGILHVRGPHVMAGYWRDSAATEKTLIPGDIPGERHLCTHDLFRRDAMGLLYFIGRTDDIIKTRGEKVSPLEIEHVLLGIPGVVDAAVFGIADDVLGESIVAFVSTTPESQQTSRSIQGVCKAHLENFMVPDAVHILPELPKSSNGKIDKRVLRGRL